MNRIELLGNIASMETVTTHNQSSILRISLAVNRNGKDKVTDFINCTAFGKRAEIIEKYFHKGSKIAIYGRLHNNNYTSKKGVKIYGYSVIIDGFDFCEKSSKQHSKDDKEIFFSIEDDQSNQLPF